MDIKNEISLVLKDLLKKITKEQVKFLVEKPENENFGDYSSNIALVTARILKKNPFDFSCELVKELNNLSSELQNIDKIEAVKPGFVNFWISEKYLKSKLKEINEEKEKYGNGKSLRNKKIMVEFTDPNPFKEFHIGHLYNNTVGESVSRLLEVMGADLKRANYQGDVGMHVAKALYGIQNSKIRIEDLEKKHLREKIKILGEAYALGAKVYEEDEEKKEEIEQLNKKIYDKDPTVVALYEKGRQWSLEYFENVYKRLGTKFDFYYFESEVGVNGLKLVKEYLEKDIFEKSQGAVIFPGKKYGLHDRVFINSLGLPTYEAKDLGLALKKYKDFKYDRSISITGNEIIGYFKVILEALKQIDPEIALKIKHLPHGMVRLPTGKMSSRSGNILTGEWLLDETKKLLKSKFKEMSEDTLEKVTVGSVKYALLKNSLGHDVEFDFEESINIQGNSGPYIQYTFARTQSVLEKTKNEISLARPRPAKLEAEEISLLRALNKFPELVGQAGEKFAPNILCNFLFDLAQKFNLFYQKCKIIGSDQENFRLELTTGVGQVIKNGLNLLGISAPEKM
jgi:arginyl-tRNA synthetase